MPLILQFVLAALCTCFQPVFNALPVDIFAASPVDIGSTLAKARSAAMIRSTMSAPDYIYF